MAGNVVVSLLTYSNGLPRDLTAERCVEWARELVNEGGRVQFVAHSFDRMEERDVTTTQALTVLRRGELTAGPEWCPEFENWKFTMRADTAGQFVSVGAAIGVDPLMSGECVFVITVFA